MPGRAKHTPEWSLDGGRHRAAGPGADPRLHPSESAKRRAVLPVLPWSSAGGRRAAVRGDPRGDHRAGIRWSSHLAVAHGYQGFPAPRRQAEPARRLTSYADCVLISLPAQHLRALLTAKLGRTSLFSALPGKAREGEQRF